MQNSDYSSQPPPIPTRPTYGNCMEPNCNCSSINCNEHDSKRCANCSHDTVMHLQLENLSLNDNINQLNYGGCNELHCNCPAMIPTEHDHLICFRCKHDHLIHVILPSNENQLQYGRCLETPCNCPCMIMNEQDPTKCFSCHHDHLIHLNFDNQMNCNVNIYNQIQPPLPLQVRERPPPDTIWFYNRNDPYYEFTNFQEGFPIKAVIPFPGPILEVKNWPTSEHLFQAAKFQSSKVIADGIRRCHTARDALNMARQYREFMDHNWQSINVKVMEWVVRCKFEQHGFLARLLLNTGDKKLVEHTEVDKFWGDGGDGSGQNMLGEILMRVRQNLRETRSHQHNYEYDQSRGIIDKKLIYPMTYYVPLPSSSQDFRVWNGPNHPNNTNIRNIEREEGSSQQPLISEQQEGQPVPPPLPPRRNRDIQLLKQQHQALPPIPSQAANHQRLIQQEIQNDVTHFNHNYHHQQQA
ncbi:10858_t:CDS:2 [Funneliformis geosporum]|uniref:18167_t:CDS:1 n=1 Tax=Funneliformis geosporum TaxID=1117311 RepID=A0A9W4SBN0_9GLOM|nr:10858_t:CDS:2 [Funneliformis geosporum]CAI2163403.1 18167_t:CDS:2 [Funneliformis geosporum]